MFAIYQYIQLIYPVSFAGARFLKLLFELGDWAAQKFGASFPYGTLIINFSGSFLLGLFMTLATERLIVKLEPGISIRQRLSVTIRMDKEPFFGH